MKNSRLLCCVLLLMCHFTGVGQDVSNKGRDFWITYPTHIDGNASAMGIYITASVDAAGTITVGTKTIPFTLTANSVVRKFIGPSAQGDAPNTSVYLTTDDGIVSGAGIHVVSDNPVAVYAHIIKTSRSGATLVLPSNVWGKEYIVPSYQNYGSAAGYGAITVVAAESNTTIQVIPSANSKNGLKQAGGTYTVTLPNPGDVYQLQFLKNDDISGTRVQSISNNGASCKKIAVFSSTSWSAFDCGASSSGGDNLYQQLFPVGSWGKNFMTSPFKNRPYDIVRVFVNDPNAIVQKTENGVTATLTGLQPKNFYEFKTANPTFIQSDKQISVVQYITSTTCKTGCTTNSANVACLADPEMIVLNPIEQTINNITVFSAYKSFVPVNQSAISNCFLNIIIKSNATSSFKINGVAPISSFTPIQGTSYSYLQEEITATAIVNPVQNLVADSNFSAIAYGFGPVESYGYNAGTNVKDFTPIATFQNTYNRIDSAVTCVNSPFKFSVPLSYVPTSIKWDFGTANITPNATVIPSTITADSSKPVNGLTLNYYSPQNSYTFTKVNTSALRDTIKLYTTSATPDGCGSTDQVYTIPVTVGAAPTADFSISHNGCVSDTMQLTDQSNGNGGSLARWIWDFGDGTGSDLRNGNPLAKVYAAVGTGSYDVKLTVASDIGCASGPVTKTVKLSSKPVASYTVPAITCVNDAIRFTDASTIQVGSVAKWIWDLDNGAGAVTNTTNAAQTNTYTSFGPKDVKLLVESSTGCKSDTFRINPKFTVNAIPEPGFIIPEVCLNDAGAVFTDTTKIADGSTGFTYLWNFNAATPPFSPAPTVSGSATTSKNPTVHYNDKGNYKVSLRVSSNGCVASLTKDFTVNGANPVPAFEVQQPTGLCSNDSVRIKNKSTVDFGAVTRLVIYWDANDTTRKTIDENPAIDKIYAFRYADFQTPATKTYSVSLQAFSGNALSCSKSVTQTVTVNASPKVSFTTLPGICNEASARQITQATFDANVPGTFVYTGTGVSSTGLFNPQTAGVGSFPIKYVSTSAMGCRDSATRTITVWPSPAAQWAIAGTICQKNDIVFVDTSVANFSKISQRKWNYDDGTATVIRTNDSSYKRQFATAKTYNISLQVITDSGCTSLANTQAIKVNYLPKVGFSLPAICLPDGRGQFNNQTTIDDGSEALFSYLWNFHDPNDASSSTLKDPVHKYSALGPYDVQLRVTSKDGCFDSLTQSLTTVYPQPKADFSITASEICAGDTIRFTDLGNGITGSAISWVWDLANGTVSSLQNPVKKYTDTGTFTVKYYFFNTQGCVSDTAVKQITVNAFPVLLMGPNLKVLEGGVITIKPKFVYGTALQYLWTPGLYLNSDTSSTPKSTPADDITYKLTLTGKGSCSVTDTIFIQVLKSPEVPNAFSPNGDGINDTWRIKYLESYPGAEIEVYNRYGQKVYYSIGYDKDWDGTYGGKPLPVGTYYYIINPKNGRQIIQGSVTIIK